MKTEVIVKTQFEALHHWNDIPDVHPSHYLKYPHRHVFHITLWCEVSEHNRQIEFIDYKRKLDGFLKDYFAIDQQSLLPTIESRSCEMLAGILLRQFPKANRVEVLEDGEMGAIVYV